MKVKYLTCLLLLLMAVPYCQAILSLEVKDILDKYIPTNIHLPTLDYPSTKSCKGYWKTNGVACDATLLAAYASADAANLTLAEKEFNNTIDLMHSTLKLMSPDMHRLRDAHARFNSLLSPDNILKIKTQSNTCWNYMKLIRSNSLCSTCAGNNYRFYQKYNAAFSNTDCEAIFTHCRGFFDTVRNTFFGPIIDMVNILQSMDPKYPSPLFDPKRTSNWSVMTGFEELMFRLEWSESFLRLPSAGKSQKDAFTKAKSAICEDVVRINNEPTIQYFITISKIDISLINRDYQSIKARIKNEPVESINTQKVGNAVVSSGNQAIKPTTKNLVEEPLKVQKENKSVVSSSNQAIKPTTKNLLEESTKIQKEDITVVSSVNKPIIPSTKRLRVLRTPSRIIRPSRKLQASPAIPFFSMPDIFVVFSTGDQNSYITSAGIPFLGSPMNLTLEFP